MTCPLEKIDQAKSLMLLPGAGFTHFAVAESLANEESDILLEESDDHTIGIYAAR
jgi:hypothetical protein